MRVVAVTLIVFALAGCGSSKHAATTSTTAAPPSPTTALPGSKALYQSGVWAVVVKGGTAVALHLEGTTWHPDRTGKVKVALIGPHAVDAKIPQVAATLAAKSPLAESALWVDGVELLEKGGGLTPTSGTIYGAPVTALSPGTHVAVAYARTAINATAVAKTFRVR